ncbi:MAG: 30S ribosomal protein S6 [Anaerolineae bacterium]|nr:30S ribosomal protein S6 [Anaerolineae bacterium]
MRPYELVFIVAPQQDDEKVQAQIDTVTKRIAGYGGEVTKLSVWGKRKLAYPIKKFREGHYVVVQMQMPAEAVKQLDRDLLISENVIRHLIVRLDEE